MVSPTVNAAAVNNLQHEKEYLSREVFNLQETVSVLEHKGVKLRKSKKKLRHQLDQVKNQLLVAKTSSVSNK